MDTSEEEIKVQLDELELLAETAGANIEDRVVQKRSKINPAKKNCKTARSIIGSLLTANDKT